MNAPFHGGGLDAAMTRFGGAAEDWLDLSTGINPDAWPLRDISVSAWQRLPGDRAQEELLAAARVAYRLNTADQIVAANGTQALIQRLPEILGSRTVSIVEPCYAEHRYCWELAGATVVSTDSVEEGATAAEIVVVGNPNNPDCRRHAPEALAKLAAELSKKDGFLIVDEAFCDVEPGLSLIPTLPENAIVLRSFGKFFGLAGVRLGFAIAGGEIIAKLARAMGPWAVSGPALEIGRMALSDQAWIGEARDRISQKSAELAAVLTDAGLEVCGNAGLFIDTRHAKAANIHRKLMEAHILVRAFEQRPEHLRFGLYGEHDELERVQAALMAAVPEGN